MKHDFKIGDRVKLVRLDGALSTEAVVIHDIWADESSNRNASFMSGNQEHHTHTDLMRHENDKSPVIKPDGGIWYIARGNDFCWGRAQTVEGAVRNMRRNGKPTEYFVHRVSKWTRVDGMGSLTYPEGIAPVEMKHIVSKKK